ncbi:sodium-coupled monocarboxylate transporter 2-like isoform X1 [Ciona intestinalis]
MVDKVHFGVGDILVFLASLVLSMFVGVYYAFKDRRRETVDNYYYASRKMSAVPLGLSISVTFISALTVIGLPTETYIFGFVTIWHCTTLVLPTVIACLYYIPLIHRLRLATIYEYLEMRFHRNNRVLSSGIEILSMILYMGTTVYIPSLALSAVTPLSTNAAILLTSGICTIYTVCGGLKAVVWTDAFQSGIMFVGTVAALIQGALVVGGFGNVWAAMERSGRFNVFTFDLDPRIRQTALTYLTGTVTSFMNIACCSQPIAQRYLSCETVKQARIAAVVAVIPKFILTSCAVCCGAVAYAYFEQCDPLKNEEIAKPDQILPYMVLKIFADVPGMAGLFVAAAYSGTLSTVSSGINSLSAMVLSDFILPRKPKLSSKLQMIISKVTGVVLGLILTVISYLCSLTNGTIISLVLTVRGSSGGPMLGVFTLGLFFPWCNKWGALVGQAVGTLFCFWIAIGSLIQGRDVYYDRVMPISTGGCPAINATNMTSPLLNDSIIDWNTTQPMMVYDIGAEVDLIESKSYNNLYLISFMYYSMIGLFVTIIVGNVVSLITGNNNTEKMDPKLFVPIIDNQCFPANVRRFFRFGVPPLGPENEEKMGNMDSGGENFPLKETRNVVEVRESMTHVQQ